MGKYGECALIAVELLTSNKKTDPIEAWIFAVIKVFPSSESSRNKGCPKNTFLALCGENHIYGVESGLYTKSIKNKNYALVAVSELKNDPSLVANEKELWRLATFNKEIKPNSQMDVVITLWNNNLIR